MVAESTSRLACPKVANNGSTKMIRPSVNQENCQIKPGRGRLIRRMDLVRLAAFSNLSSEWEQHIPRRYAVCCVGEHAGENDLDAFQGQN